MKGTCLARMTDQPTKRAVPPWLYKLFTGHQYPYVRRLAKFAQPIHPGEERQEPTKEMIEAKFWEVFPHCSVKILQEVKTGMIVVFHDLGEYPAGRVPGTHRQSRGLSGKNVWEKEDQGELLPRRQFRVHDQL